MASRMRRRHPRQQQRPGDLIPDDRQQNHEQARQLNPFVRRRFPAPGAYRTFWKYSQTAMLAIHGNLAFPELGTQPQHQKPTPGEKRSLLVARAGPGQRTDIVRKPGSQSRVAKPGRYRKTTQAWTSLGVEKFHRLLELTRNARNRPPCLGGGKEFAHTFPP